MNKQRSVTVELLVIFLFTAGVSALIWNSNPFGSSPPSPVITASGNTDSGHVNPKHLGDSQEDEHWQNGKSLFKSNCASCHNPAIAQTGPALKGALQRWEGAGSYHGKSGKEWMYTWIKNWNQAVASGYPYAVSIQHYNETNMNTFPSLRDEQIDDILKYVEDASRPQKPVASR